MNDSTSPTDNAGDDLLRVKQKLSTSMKKRSRLMQSDDYVTAGGVPAEAPAPPAAEPAPAAPESAPTDQPLRTRRLKRTGHFELKPSPYGQEAPPPEDTEY